MSKKITYQVGLGLLSLVMVGANAQAETNVRVKAGAVTGTYDNVYSPGGREDEVDFGGVELSAALLFNEGMFVELKSSKLEADAADVDSNNPAVDQTDWTRDELALNFGFAAGGGGIVIGFQDNSTVNETAAVPAGFGDVELTSTGLTFAYGLLGNFGESNFGYSATLGLGVMDGNLNSDSGVDADADYTFGYSLGLGLSYAPIDHLTLAADYRLQAYEFEFSDVFTTGDTLTIEETINRFVFSAAYTF